MKLPGEQLTALRLEKPELRHFEINLERKAVVTYPQVGGGETVPAVIPGPLMPWRLRNLIPATGMIGSGIFYVRETSFTSSTIIPVAPNTVKGQASLTYDVQYCPVATIPAFLKISSQAWEDFSMFQNWIDTRLAYGLNQAEENQLLNGNGVAPNLQGLMLVALPVPAVTPAPPAGGPAVLANVAAGIAFVYSKGYIVTGIVLNPADWGSIFAAQGAGGEYLMYPGMTLGLSLWGIPVVLSTAMAKGSYLVGQFDPFCQIFDRQEVTLEVADQNQDDFIKNLLTVLSEERLAFAIYQPAAFGKGTF